MRVVVMLLIAGCGRVGFAPRAEGEAGIAWHGTATQSVPQSGGTSITVAQPDGCTSSDVLVAVIAEGTSASAQPPVFTAPGGWTQLRRFDRATDTTLVGYWHAATDHEPADYTWSTNQRAEGVAWISCYGGVDRADPVLAEDGVVVDARGTAYTMPSITTLEPALLLLTYAGHGSTPPAVWTAPAGTTARANLNNGTTRSGLSAELGLADAGPTPSLTAVASVTMDYALLDVLALRETR